MEKENLDNLFRESLDEFSASPDPRVWDRIQASLDKKNKHRRRAIPLWWPMGGAAAAAALLLYLLIPRGDIESLPRTEPVTDKPAVISTQQEPNANPIDSEVVDQGLKVSGNETQEVTVREAMPPQQTSENLQPAPGISSIENATVEKTPKDIHTDAGPALAAQKEEAKNTSLDGTGGESPSTVKTDALVTTTGKPLDDTAVSIKEDDVQAAELAEAAQQEALKELLPEKEDEPLLEKDGAEGKWAIGPSVAPVYFSGLGEGSPIDQSFVSNEKSGSFNMSYGLQVSYQLNKRLQLRSGLHKVDFGYNTKDIVFSSSLQASSASEIRNIDFSPASEYLVVNSQNALPAKSDSGIRSEIAARNTSREGTMVQEFGYLEVPLELNYTVIDRTLGVHLISGISSMFLVDNNVSLESGTGTTEVGKANNLNEVNFSANFGLGVQYKVNEKINLQVEPLLKYQLNTFSNTAGNFRPYSIGVYSGIRFKF